MLDAPAAVSDLSLKAERNEIVALVGPSGSGKTTVAGLISRFFDPQEGQIFIGGVDVRQISKEELMRHVAYVFQDSRLLKRSIADNLRIANQKCSTEQVCGHEQQGIWRQSVYQMEFHQVSRGSRGQNRCALRVDCRYEGGPRGCCDGACEVKKPPQT